MSSVILVRHAQASFLEPNYDKLCATGEVQARLLGRILGPPRSAASAAPARVLACGKCRPRGLLRRPIEDLGGSFQNWR